MALTRQAGEAGAARGDADAGSPHRSQCAHRSGQRTRTSRLQHGQRTSAKTCGDRQTGFHGDPPSGKTNTATACQAESRLLYTRTNR